LSTAYYHPLWGEWTANVVLSSPAVPPKTCLVSFTGPTGIRHSVEVTAETLYEAAALGLNLLRSDDWVQALAPGTEIQVRVCHPSTSHTVTLAQLRRWCDGVAVSPDEILKKNRLRALLG